jgi:hypothetical protein
VWLEDNATVEDAIRMVPTTHPWAYPARRPPGTPLHHQRATCAHRGPDAEAEVADGRFYLGRHVDRCWTCDEGVRYLEETFTTGERGAVKGTDHPDGRKDC